MKKNSVVCVFLCICLLIVVSAPAFAAQMDTGAQSDLSVTNGCRTADAQVPLMGSGKLLDTAGAAVLFEVGSETLMYAWNPDIPMEPASLVKIMTGLLAVEQGDLSEVVTVRAEALKALGDHSSTTNLQAGECIALSDLLYCLLVGSSNDAAVVIADHIAGSQDAFVAQMNAKCESLGMHATVFTNPHGLHDENQYTTARDMTKLVAYALKIEPFMPFFAQTTYTVPSTNLSEARELSSTNYMMVQDKPLYFDSRVTGGRTGITSDRNRCLAVSAKSDSLFYVGVILDAVPVFKDDGYTVQRFGSYEEMGELLDMGFDGYQLTQVLGEGQVLMQCNVNNGANSVSAVPAQSVSAVLPSGLGMEKLTVQYQQNIHVLNAPVENGETLTQVQVWYNNVCIAQSPIVAGNNAPLAFGVVIPHSVESGFDLLRIILIVLAVMVLAGGVFVGVLVGIRYFRKITIQAQRRRRRSERRRSR